MIRPSRLFAAAAWIVLAAGCASVSRCPEPPKTAGPARYEEARLGDLPGWDKAMLAPALRALLESCARVANGHALAPACASARALPSDDEVAARRFFETEFTAYAIVSAEGSREGLVTGYYEPVLAGSRKRTDVFRYPIHGLPSDLVVVDLASVYPELNGMRLRGRLEGRRVVPYYSRSEIDTRSDALAAPVIAWVADPVELFFLQIQGSGQVVLADTGERIRVGYADQNGHPYNSLGRHLVQRGELALEHASMQGIQAWAAANPAKLREALNANASYVFFREQGTAAGPVGALGAPLTAGYSLAVDRRHVPLGTPVYLATTYPNSSEPLERLMLAQDTGGAIRGAVRADFYWGTGKDAGEQAGRMRQQGRMWVLWPRGAALPRP
jgi:membrane-bound lytic murein transglycosylase A